MSLSSLNNQASDSNVMWNLWHGCTKVSPGCYNCYVYAIDAKVNRDASIVYKTTQFEKPLEKYKTGEYKYPSGTTFYTCFTSDFFHEAADDWRSDAWRIIRTRSDCYFYIITKRPERIAACLPSDWGNGYPNVELCCTCENQSMTDKRLPIFLELPIVHKSIIHEPILGPINLEPFLEEYRDVIECVTVGGESGDFARLCNYGWVLSIHMQCVKYEVDFVFHQTGSKFKKKDRIYFIPKDKQHIQAKKARLDFRNGRIVDYSELFK